MSENIHANAIPIESLAQISMGEKRKMNDILLEKYPNINPDDKFTNGLSYGNYCLLLEKKDYKSRRNRK